MKFIIFVSFITLSFQSFSASSEWSGEYALTQQDDAGTEPPWTSHLSVHDCTEKTCQYEFDSGSSQGSCSSSGTLQIKSPTRAEDLVVVKADQPQDARGECLVTVERRKGGKAFVDAKDVFKTKKDEDFGSPCNSLCGAQGARYFAIEIPKVSEKRFYNPSFGCTATKLNKIEIAICTSEKLAGLDHELGDRVADAKAKSSKMAEKVTAAQRIWIKSRNEKCSKSKDLEHCLETVYQDRLKQLKP